MKSYLIFGKSGCGKSYLVKRIMVNLRMNESHRKTYTDRKSKEKFTYYNKGNFYILGKYDVKQAGLDNQPRSLQNFVNWLENTNENAMLLMEGFWYDHKIEYTKKYYLEVSTDKCTELKKKRNGGKNFVVTDKQINMWNNIENSKDVRECQKIPYETDNEREIALKFFTKLFTNPSNETNTEKAPERKLF